MARVGRGKRKKLADLILENEHKDRQRISSREKMGKTKNDCAIKVHLKNFFAIEIDVVFPADNMDETKKIIVRSKFT